MRGHPLQQTIIDEINQLKCQGYSDLSIAKTLNLNRCTVKKYTFVETIQRPKKIIHPRLSRPAWFDETNFVQKLTSLK